jgi:hypothetical protein
MSHELLRTLPTAESVRAWRDAWREQGFYQESTCVVRDGRCTVSLENKRPGYSMLRFMVAPLEVPSGIVGPFVAEHAVPGMAHTSMSVRTGVQYGGLILDSGRTSQLNLQIPPLLEGSQVTVRTWWSSYTESRCTTAERNAIKICQGVPNDVLDMAPEGMLLDLMDLVWRLTAEKEGQGHGA